MTLDTLHAAPADPTAPKPWYQSKTLVVSIGTLIALFVTQLLQNAGALHLDAQTVIWITMGLTTFLAALRLVTNTAIEGTAAAAHVEAAKEDVAFHAAISATAPEAGPLSVDDIGRLLEQVRRERDDRNALLDKAAAMASAPPATMPPAPTTLNVSAVMPPPVTAP